MTNYQFKKPTVFNDSSRNMTVLFQLDIPSEGSVNLKHPDLAGIIEDFIKDAYEKIPLMGAETFHKKLIRSWKVCAQEYANFILETIQQRPRNTKEVRYLISYTEKEINHNVQMLTDDGAVVGLIFVPGFTARAAVVGPETTQDTEKAILSFNLDMSTTDAEQINESAKFHAGHIDESLKNFLDHSEFVYKQMIAALETNLNNLPTEVSAENREYSSIDDLPRYAILATISNISSEIVKEKQNDKDLVNASISVLVRMATVVSINPSDPSKIEHARAGFSVSVTKRHVNPETKKVSNQEFFSFGKDEKDISSPPEETASTETLDTQPSSEDSEITASE